LKNDQQLIAYKFCSCATGVWMRIASGGNMPASYGYKVVRRHSPYWRL